MKVVLDYIFYIFILVLLILRFSVQSRVLLEMVVLLQLVKKFPAFLATRIF